MNKLLDFLKVFIPFSILLLGTQYIVIASWFENVDFFYQMGSVYAFNIISALIIYIFLIFVHRTFPEKTGFAFLAGGILKMMAVLIFLMPLINADVKDPIPDMAAFFIPYFLFLFFETFLAVRLINQR
jgi:hypothetical protein